ncbi:MAG: TonB-dependent receptor plug domain-containing protein, partial [Winogradskyella sp.]|nr:TonB-dependent receptor plug domain-containing protein [Winogradskyella sp.]
MKVACVLLIFTLATANAQTIKVLEAGSNEPISGVLISNKNKSKTVITNFNGEAVLDKFEDNEVIFFENLIYNSAQSTKAVLQSSNNQIFLTLSIEGLNEVVISVSKFEQSKRDIPQTVVSIDQEEIAFTNPQTSADLLNATGNIFLQKSQLGGGSPIIRGFSTNRLLISVDGVRMNNAIFRGGNIQNVISIDPFTIKNTEVTLGAGSVVYGSDAIGGVMNFYTSKPQLSYKDSLFFKGNALLRYSSANEESTSHVDLNFGFKKWAFLSSFSFTDYDDLRMGRHGPEAYLRDEFVVRQSGTDLVVSNPNPLIQRPTAYNQINLMQKARYEASDKLFFDFGVHYSTTSDYTRYDRLILFE